jgi:hypothetical protein
MPGVSMTPRRAEVTKDIRDFEGRPVHLRLRLTCPALLGLVAQQIERTLDTGNHAGGNTRVTRGRLQFLVTEQRLDFANIDARFQQMCRKTVPKRMQRDRLADAGGFDGLLEETAKLPCCKRLHRSTPREDKTLLQRHVSVKAAAAQLPPLPQKLT